LQCIGSALRCATGAAPAVLAEGGTAACLFDEARLAAVCRFFKELVDNHDLGLAQVLPER
jgi:hypothetical protein